MTDAAPSLAGRAETRRARAPEERTLNWSTPDGRWRDVRVSDFQPPDWLVPWLVPLSLLLIWQIAAQLGWISPTVLPAPSEVLAAGWRLTLNGELPENVLVSGRRALSGFAVGGSLAFTLGLLNGLSRTSERLTDTTVQMLRNIPNLALIPLVILWFGIEEDAKLFLTALGVFFPIYVNTFHGVRTVDPQLVEMGRSYGMDRFELFRRVILPGALPSIFVGLRYALGIMWLTLIVAETIAANSGIGYMATNAREFMLVDVVVLAILIYAALGKVADSTVRVLERLCLSWHPAFRKVRT
jgi:sulfonate transport system permease protein